MDFKVRCTKYIKDATQQFTEGKVYDVKDNHLISDTGYDFNSWSYEHNGNADFEALRKWFERHYTFELVEDSKVFTANDLKTGMFGVLSSGDKFVVVNDHLVYQDDGYDHIRTMFDNDDSYAYIDKVWEGIWSFRMLDRVLSGKATYGTLVYDYERDTKKYYNGKVVCVEEGYSFSEPVSKFTIGKIYEIENGVIVSDKGYKSDAYYGLDALCTGMGWRFIPIVE